MKKVFLMLAIFTIANFTRAQILKRISDRAKQKLEQKVDQKVDKTIDDATDPKKKTDDSKSDSKAGSNNNNKNNSENNNANGSGDGAMASHDGATANGPSTLKNYSKYDFVPGEKVIVVEDFSQDAIGDFPAKWNTNSSGEVVTADGETGHWLMISKKGRFIPEYISSLPENFTLQFDLVCNEKFNYYSNALDLFILTGASGKEALENSFIQMEKRSGVKLNFHPANGGSNGGQAGVESYEDGTTVINNEVNTSQFNASNGKTKLKVSIWRQKQRVRVYFNEEKVYDLPRAFAANKNYSTLIFQIWSGMNNDVDRYLLSNIKLAVGAPDTRNKLITEGKFVTTGILFDVNSDKIKPESYGVLKDIASVLKENADVKIKIIGHTDSDGDDNTNLELSKKRSASVKNALVEEFNINAERIQTDGMGEKQPIGDNNKPEGKANNRRVEFVKL